MPNFYDPTAQINAGFSALQPGVESLVKKQEEDKPLSPFERRLAQVALGQIHPKQAAAEHKVEALLGGGAGASTPDYGAPSPPGSQGPQGPNTFNIPYNLASPDARGGLNSLGGNSPLDSISSLSQNPNSVPFQGSAPQGPIASPSRAPLSAPTSTPPQQSSPSGLASLSNSFDQFGQNLQSAVGPGLSKLGQNLGSLGGSGNQDDSLQVDENGIPIPRTREEFNQIMQVMQRTSPYYSAGLRAQTAADAEAGKDRRVDKTEEGKNTRTDTAQTGMNTRATDAEQARAAESEKNRQNQVKVANIYANARKKAGVAPAEGPPPTMPEPGSPEDTFTAKDGPGVGVTYSDKDANKAFKSAGDILSRSQARSNIAKNESRIQAIDRLDTLVLRKGANGLPDVIADLTPNEMALVYTELGTIVGQGKPTEAEIKSLTPETFTSSLAKRLQYAGDPQGAGMQSFLQRVLDNSHREKDLIRGQITDGLSEQLPLLSELMRSNDGRYRGKVVAMLHNAHLDPDAFDVQGGIKPGYSGVWDPQKGVAVGGKGAAPKPTVAAQPTAPTVPDAVHQQAINWAKSVLANSKSTSDQKNDAQKILSVNGVTP